jgi:hypothetical protein
MTLYRNDPPRFDRDDPTTWGGWFKPTIIAHDVGRSHDRSTAVIGGNCPIEPDLLGITELHELPQGLYASARASALAAIDRAHHCDALIVADLSSDETYGEVLHDTFGPRVIGLHITRSGNGMNFEWRPVRNKAQLVYTIGRTYLIELFHREMQAHRVRFVDGPESRRAFEQLVNLQTELRESGTVYTCPASNHDDLGISCAMLAWAARHPHLERWFGMAVAARRPPRPREPPVSWNAFT